MVVETLTSDISIYQFAWFIKIIKINHIMILYNIFCTRRKNGNLLVKILHFIPMENAHYK